MTTTWATRLAGDEHNLRLYFTVQGVPDIFQEDVADVDDALEDADRPRRRLVVSIDQAETRLNLDRRRIEGGSLTIRLQDDDDGTLAAFFTPRKYRQTYATATHTTSGTTLTVKATSWAASGGGDAYVGGETITYTAKTSTTLTGCTRGAYSSEAQAHFGSSTDGAYVFDSPPSWIGRRVYLKGYFLLDDGTTTSDLSTGLGVFRVGSAPRHLGDDIWELACTDLSEEFGTKKLGGGLIDVKMPDSARMQYDYTSDHHELAVDVGEGEAQDQFVVGSVTTYALLNLTAQGSIPLCYAIYGQLSTNAVELDAGDQIMGMGGSQRHLSYSGHGSIDSVRHIAVLRYNAAKTALYIIASRLGDLANGSHDVLPGLDRTDFGGGEWRFGAGILDAEVDNASFIAAGLGSNWSYIIDEEVSLADFLFEFCLHTGTAWLATRAGKLGVVSLAEDGTTSVLTVDSSVIVEGKPVTVSYAEDSIFPRVHLKCSYDVVGKTYRGTFNAYDAEMQRRYPFREDSLELKSKSIVLDTEPTNIQRPVMTQAEISGLMRRLQAAEGRGRAYVTAVCHLTVLAAEIGSVVTLTAAVPDLEGSTPSARSARVVSMRPRYGDGEVDVTFQLLDKLWRVAPGVVIASASSAVMTLQTTGPETASTTPGRMFGADNLVQIWDVSAGTFVDRTVLSVTDTTITLDSAPGFTVQANIDFVRFGNQVDNDTATTDDGYAGLDWLYQMPNDENDYGSVEEITRWR